MSDQALVIGIDLGTSGVRAVALDPNFVIHGQGRALIDLKYRRRPEYLWDAVIAAVGALCKQIDHRRVVAIAVDGTSGTLIPTDKSGLPLGPLSLYNDHATTSSVEKVRAIAPPESAVHGVSSPLARMLDLAETPKLGYFMHEADWIAHRLGAAPGFSDANNALKSGYDPIQSCWPDWMTSLNLDLTLLPQVFAPGQPIGTISQDTSMRFGFSDTTKLIAGTTDGCASFLATGANAAGDGVTTLGSTLTIKLLSDHPVLYAPYGIYSHFVQGLFIPGGASNAGAAVLAKFFTPEQIATLSTRIDPDKDSGLDYYPLLAPGERFPINDPSLLPRLTPRPADDALFLHGMLEGLARIEATAYERLTALGAPPLRRVLTVGGGSANPVWTALRHRIIGVPVTTASCTEAAAGVARLALSGIRL